MRKKSPLDSLISKTNQGLLAVLVLHPDRWWYMSDLAKRLDRRPSSLQTPLASLVAAGILRRRKEGNRVYFQADPDCPFLPELQGIIAKTVGLVDVLREVLASFERRIEVAFVHGSVAKSAEGSASDVDLILIGSVGLKQLSPALESAEERLGRAVNASLYTRDEFAEKLAAKNHFLLAVLDKEKLFVVGGENDLGKAARGQSR